MLPEIKTVLFAIDLSDQSGRAMRYAVIVARRFGAELVLLHVMEQADEMMEHQVEFYLTDDELRRAHGEGRKRAEAALHARIERFWRDELGPTGAEPDPLPAIHVVRGRPARTIIDRAAALGADLIVMGTQGHSRLEHLLVGSVASRVVQRSHVPVLLVPLADTA